MGLIATSPSKCYKNGGIESLIDELIIIIIYAFSFDLNVGFLME